MIYDMMTSRENKMFDLVHGGVKGPYKVPTYDGHRFFLALVDDHTRMVWIYLLNFKSDVPIVLNSFLELVKNHFETTVKIFRKVIMGRNSSNLLAKFYSVMQGLFIKAHSLTHLNKWGGEKKTRANFEGS